MGAKGTASARALWLGRAWSVSGGARRSLWLEWGEQREERRERGQRVRWGQATQRLVGHGQAFAFCSKCTRRSGGAGLSKEEGDDLA